MFTYRLAWVVIVIGCLTLTGSAQSSRAAKELYNRGQQRYTKRDLNGALADFTKVIELSSRPGGSASQRSREWQAKADLQADASEQITLIDPLAAAAYTDRALVRFHQGDVEGAIADCDRAIAIDPGLA